MATTTRRVDEAGVLRFGDFELDLSGRELRRAGRSVGLQAKPLSLLLYLAENRHRTVSKDELLEQLWPDVVVCEAALSSALKDLRRALGDDGSRQSLIRTQRRRGYRFVAEAQEEAHGAAAPRGAFVRALDLLVDRAREQAPSDPPQDDPARSRRPPFVGRRAESERLSRRLASLPAGDSGVVLVTGEAGIGKSRLVDEVLGALSHETVGVCRGRCVSQASLPLQPFVEILSDLAADDEDFERILGEDASLLRPVLEPHGGALSEPDPTRAPHAGQERAQLFSALARVLLESGRGRSLVLWIEDLHWADPQSMAFVAELVEALAPGPRRGPGLLLLATARPPEAPGPYTDLLQRLESLAGCEELALSGLEARHAERLLAGIHEGPLRSGLLEQAVHLTRGNPLFLMEVARRLAGAPDAELPADLDQALAERLEQLGSEACSVLAIAAVIGDRFGTLALAAASGLAQEAVREALEECRVAGLVEGEGRAFRFGHPLVRHTLLSSLDARTEQQLHGAIARVLEDLYASTPADHAMEIAFHLVRAGDGVDAEHRARVCRRAAAQAFGGHAWAEAARYYQAAAESDARLADRERAELHLRAGLAHNHDWAAEACIEQYRRAASLYDRVGDRAGLVSALIYLTRAQFTLGSVDLGSALDLAPLEAAIEGLGDEEGALRGMALGTLSEAYWTMGKTDRALAAAEQSLVLGRNRKDDRLCHHASMGLALAQMQSMQVQEASDQWRMALAHARRVADPWLESTPLPRIALAQIHLGRIGDAEQTTREAIAAAERCHNAGEASFARAQWTSLVALRGALHDAEEAAEECTGLMRRSGYPWSGPLALPALAGVYAHRGDAEASRRVLAELTTPGRVFEDPGPAMQILATVLGHWAETWAAPERAPSTERVGQLVRAVRTIGLDASGLTPLCALVDLAYWTGAEDAAADALEVLEVADLRGVRLSAGWPFSVGRARGVAALTAGDLATAEACLDGAIAFLESVGALPELALAHLVVASAWPRKSALFEKPIQSLERAEAIARSLALAPVRRDAAQLREREQA